MNQLYEIEAILLKMAKYGELLGHNPFKTRALTNAARKIANLNEFDLEKIKTLSGVGPGVFAIVKEYASTKTVSELEDMEKDIPQGVQDMLGVSGLGPLRVKKLWRDLGLTSIGELLYACQENRLVKFKGFGPKMQQKIQENVEFKLASLGKIRLDQGIALSLKLQEILSTVFTKVIEVEQVALKEEIISSLSFAALSLNEDKEKNALIKKIPNVKFDFTKETIKFTFEDMTVTIFCSHEKSAFGFFCLSLRSPKKFMDTLERLSLEEKGLSVKDLSIQKQCLDEEALFQELGLYYLCPEERFCKNFLVKQGQVRPKIIDFSQMLGAFHNHTQASDGQNTLAEMVQEAKKLGLTYLSISDHSKSAFYASGLDEKRLLDQIKEIYLLNENLKDFHVFTGSEVDILKTGELDFLDSLLAKLDIVIASVHSRFKESFDDMTTRLKMAVTNPHVHILGHPTGRLILSRKPYEYDLEDVIKSAQKNQVALELNANPHRLDLKWEQVKVAKDLKAKVAINADAHSVSGLKDLYYGVMMAKKAGLLAEDVLNTYSVSEVKKWCEKKNI